MNLRPKGSLLQQNLILNLTQFTQEGKGYQQKISQKRNSSTFLNQTLNGLNNQFIRRTCTEKNPLKQQPKKQQNKTGRIIKSQIQSNNQNAFAPQPWKDDFQIFQTQLKAPLTEIRQKKQKIQNMKKSFHITQVPNKFYKKNYGNSSIQEMRKSSFTSKDLTRSYNSKIKNFTFKTEPDHKEQMKQKNYNYTNQQKVKITLDYIVQKKKHSKMSNLLKMKTHSFDKTLKKSQKINHESKNLIEALERLPSDKNLKKSIDRAVDMLKKRTSHSLQSNKSISPKKKLSGAKSIVQQTSKNWLSCKKIDIQKPDVDRTKDLKKVKSSNNQYFTLVQNFEIRPENYFAIKQKCKISFKPKRNYLVSRKQSKIQQKNQKSLKSKQFKVKSQNSIKKKISIGVLLQVNHIN